MVELHQQIGRYALLIGALFIATLLAALAASLYLQRFISRPVLALADRAAAITRGGDYSLPAQPIPSSLRNRRDEIGMLYAGFDTMLTRIAEHELDLLAARTELEQRSNSACASVPTRSSCCSAPCRSASSISRDEPSPGSTHV